MKRLNHIYEVYTVDNGKEIIVDILRFVSEEEAKEFESGIVGDYKVRHFTMSTSELIDTVLDLRDHLLEESCSLEDEVEKLDDALHVARSYIEDIIPSMKTSTKLNAKRGTSSKVYPFLIR